MTDLHALRLAAPDARWQDSYCGLVREFVDRKEHLVPFTLALPTHDFPAFLARLAGYARGEGIPHGFVPHSTYWLVRDDIEVIGVSNLRHALTAVQRYVIALGLSALQ